MQDTTVQTDLHSPRSGGNLPPITREPTGPPGNNEPTVHDEPTGSLVISFLLLCLWSIGGGLMSLFGTWVATVRHPHYIRLGE
jgi:hypothetical protein